MRRALVAVLTSFVLAILAPPARAASDLLLVLDASGSMWGKVGGEPKIAVARRVLKDLAGKIPASTDVGLIAYGHRREGDCADIETLLPLAPLDAAKLGAVVDRLNAKGKTPIGAAAQHAIDEVKRRDTAATIVLVSDGIETCSADPCAVVRSAKTAGVTFVMHVVGFDLGDVDVSQLECTAQAGGGLYFDAKNAADLADALDQVLETPAVDEPAARLSVRATEAGKPIDAMVAVYPAGSTEAVARGRTYTGPETNPRVFPLEPGRYDVTVTHLHLANDATRKLAGVEVKEGEAAEQAVDFGVGRLAIGITRNGALSDATVTVHRAGAKEQVAGGRTYVSATSNPRMFELGPGSYDVRTRALEIADAPEVTFTEITVESGARAERSHDFPSGTLVVHATSADKGVDATVSIRRPGTTETVAQGRTYGSPKVFELTPGDYEILVTPLKVDGASAKTIPASVRKAARTEETLTFP